MTRVTEGTSSDPGFTVPDSVETAQICRKSGKLAIPDVCSADPRGDAVYTEYFAKGTVPTEMCDHHVRATICTVSGGAATEFCPEETRVSQTCMTAARRRNIHRRQRVRRCRPPARYDSSAGTSTIINPNGTFGTTPMGPGYIPPAGNGADSGTSGQGSYYTPGQLSPGNSTNQYSPTPLSPGSTGGPTPYTP